MSVRLCCSGPGALTLAILFVPLASVRGQDVDGNPQLPACSVQTPACEVRAPVCGVQTPTCGVQAPACGAERPSCGVAAPSCGTEWGASGDGFGRPDRWRLVGSSPNGWEFLGWTDKGYTYNSDHPGSHFNGPLNWNDRDQFTFNQVYLSLQRAVNTEGCGTDLGGRVDVAYGADARFAQARGLELEPDGSPRWNHDRLAAVAIPQAYVEVAYNRWSAKVGHFYSPIGYESVMSPTNFFYSHNYAMQFGGPFTLTGILGTFQVNENWALLFGGHNGWDAFSPTHQHASFLGGVNFTPACCPYTLKFAITSGNEAADAAETVFGNRLDYSLVFDWNVTERMEYVLEHRLGSQDKSTAAGGNAMWYGLTQYLYYVLDEQWKIGLREEWFRDNDGTRVSGDGLYTGNPNVGPYAGDFYEISLGLNWTPTPNLMIRPEVRWDKFVGTGLPYADGTKNTQFTAALDAIVHF